MLPILALAVFFRFYKLLDLQYYTFDDEFAAMLMRQILVGKKLILVATTATLDVPLGSFWFWLSAPFYKLANFNPVILLAFGSAMGIVSTYAIYLTGKALGNQRVGKLASLLYAGSFLTSLLDRRWWALTFNPILVTGAIYCLYRMNQGGLKFALPLAIAVSFAWHADPTLAVIGLATGLCWVIWRLPVRAKAYLPALGFLILSVAPFLIFELRHPGAVTTPYSKLLGRVSQPKVEAYNQKGTLTAGEIVLGFTRGFWAKPTQVAEDYLYPFSDRSALDFSWVIKAVVLSLVLFSGYLWLKYKEQKRIAIGLLYVFMAAFLAGIGLASAGAKINISQHYYLIIWPVLFLLAGFSLDWLVDKKQKWIVGVFLTVFLAANLNALVNSRMKYRLSEKVQLVNWAANELERGKLFSAYILGDIHLYGGGFGGILMRHNLFPSNRSYYGFDWTYRAFSLYQVPVVDEDNFDQRLVIYSEWVEPDWTNYAGVTPVKIYQAGNMKVAILRPVAGGKN